MERQEGYVKVRPQSGRPKETDQQDDDLIVREAHNSPFTTSEKSMSSSTLRTKKILNSNNL